MDLTHAGVDLAVAVGAKHDALREFRDDLLPPMGGATLTDPEVLLAWVQVVELKELRGTAPPAGHTASAHVPDGARLLLLAQLRRPLLERCLNDVAQPMAVRTKQVAFRGLDQESVGRPGEPTNTEFFRPRIPVMELKRSERRRVAALLTASTTRRDQLVLPPTPTLPLITKE